MVVGFVLGVVGAILGLAGAAVGLLFSLVRGAVVAAFMVVFLIGAIFLSPVFLWVVAGLVALCVIRGLRWLGRPPRI